MKLLYPLLDRLSAGHYIRKVVVLCIRGLAVLVALGWLLALIGILKFTFNSAAPPSASIAGMAVAAVFVAAAAAMIQVLFYRSAQISQLASGTYVLIGIVAHMIRMLAEITAVFLIAVGGSTFLAAVLAGPAAALILSGIPGPFASFATSGVAGFIVLLATLTFAFIAVVAGYLGAEFLEIIRGVTTDVRHLARGQGRICQECAQTVPEGNAFCNSCGAPAMDAVPA